MYELKVVSRFAAAHQLKMVAEKCENLHGHNWRVELYIAGKELNSAGVFKQCRRVNGFWRNQNSLERNHRFPGP